MSIMYEQLKQQLEMIKDLDFSQQPNLRGTVLLRDTLHALLEEPLQYTDYDLETVCNRLAASCQIDLTGLDNLDQVEGLVLPFAELVARLVETMLDEGFSMADIFIWAQRDLKLEYK